jgi:nitrite reductase/ring-hydroxylating ferredoxin subunit
MAKYVVGSVASMPPGTQSRVEVEGRGIAVFNDGGSFFALRDICPHQGAHLSAGTVVGAVRSSAPGCFDYDGTRKLVRCPWHGWEYELATGQSWFDPTHNRVRTLPVSVEPGSALLEPEDGSAGRRPGPYVAETVPISVEDDYVVVEL